jgi:hypothetical protein
MKIVPSITRTQYHIERGRRCNYSQRNPQELVRDVNLAHDRLRWAQLEIRILLGLVSLQFAAIGALAKIVLAHFALR